MVPDVSYLWKLKQALMSICNIVLIVPLPHLPPLPPLSPRPTNVVYCIENPICQSLFILTHFTTREINVPNVLNH